MTSSWTRIRRLSSYQPPESERLAGRCSSPRQTRQRVWRSKEQPSRRTSRLIATLSGWSGEAFRRTQHDGIAPTTQRIKSPASCSVRRGGALRYSAQHSDLVSLIYIQACGGLRAGEPPGVSHCTEFAPNDQRILMCFHSLRTTREGATVTFDPPIISADGLSHVSDWCCPISS